MKRKLFFVSILTIVFFSSNCSVLWDIGIESLAEKLRQQLKNREFGKMYDEASEHMHINATKEEFIDRVSKIVEEMERVDKDLNWQGDNTLGKTTEVDKYVTNKYYAAYKKLGEDTQKITVFITWEEVPNDKPRLFNLSADSHPNAERQFHLITAGKIVNSK